MQAQTVVGVFESSNEAMQVREELIRRGIPSDDVTVQQPSVVSDQPATGDAEREGGGLRGFFRSLFGDDTDTYADRYTDAVRRGGAIVAAHVPPSTDVREVEEIMERHHPIDVDRQSDRDVDRFGASGMTTPATSTDDVVNDTGTVDDQVETADRDSRRIPVIQEDLAVGTREVQRGAVRVFTRVQETPVEEQVRLRDRHARVERHPADRPATEEDLRALRDGEQIEIVETTEEPVVSKRARVVEEVEVGTDTTERTETIRDTVKKTDVSVDTSATPSTTTRRRKK